MRILEADSAEFLPTVREANRLYETLGFQRIDPCRRNPVDGAIFMEVRLS